MKSKKVFEARLNYLGICDSYQLSQENKMFLELRYYKLPFSRLYCGMIPAVCAEFVPHRPRVYGIYLGSMGHKPHSFATVTPIKLVKETKSR